MQRREMWNSRISTLLGSSQLGAAGSYSHASLETVHSALGWCQCGDMQWMRQEDLVSVFPW